MNLFNILHLKKIESQIAGAATFPADKDQGLPNVLYISKGAQIVLTHNI